MKEADRTRANILFLSEDRNITLSAIGQGSGAGQSWVSRFMDGTIKKPNLSKIEQIAQYLGVSAGRLMHEDMTRTAGAPPSQHVGSEEEIVAAAVKLERELAAMSPIPLPPDTYAQRLFVAMKLIQEDGAAGVLDGSTLVDAVRRLAAELRKVG